MNKFRSETLSVVAVNLRSKPGWLAGMLRTYDLTTKERLELELLDERLNFAEREVWAWEKETAFERFCGIHGLDEQTQIEKLSQNIAEAHEDYAREARAGHPYIDRHVMLLVRQIQKQERFRRGLRARQLHTMGEVRTEGKITDHEIEIARAYPLEKIIGDVDRFGRIPCLWHNGKDRNMLVKEGWGYCFVCNVSVDAIKWLMDIDRMSFLDAVRRLNGKL